MIIGITGGTGSGKTTLLEIIHRQDGFILDCDEIYHTLLTTDTIMLSSIESRFPGTVENGTLNRKKLGSIVFSDKNALLDLNRITHNAVKAEVLRRLSDAPALAAIDAIGLFEGGLADICDVTVAVIAPVEDRVCRLMARDNIPEEYAKSRIAAQHSDDWFREKCDHILVNDGNIDAFATKCLEFLHTLGIMKENQ